MNQLEELTALKNDIRQKQEELSKLKDKQRVLQFEIQETIGLEGVADKVNESHATTDKN